MNRGSIYRAYNIQTLGRNLNCCHPAIQSPESNRMLEGLVGTLKRDYVYVNDFYYEELALKMCPE